MDAPGCSFYDDVPYNMDDEPHSSQPDPDEKAMRNFRWSKGLINSKTFGLTIQSMEHLRSETNLLKVVKIATKNPSRMVLSEFERWIKSFKIKANANLTNQINKSIKRNLRSVKVAVEKAEFTKLEEEIKPYWKLTIPWARERIMASDEEYLVSWFAGDLKQRTEWSIRHGSAPKFTTDLINKHFEHFVKPLRILQRYGYRKKRIYYTFATRSIKFILGPELCETAEEALARSRAMVRSNMEKKKQKESGAVNDSSERNPADAELPTQSSLGGVEISFVGGNKVQDKDMPAQEAVENEKKLTKRQRARRRHKLKAKEKKIRSIEDQFKRETEQNTSTSIGSAEEKFQRKIDESEGHPLLLTALSDFQRVISDPDNYTVKTKAVTAESVEITRSVESGNSAINAFVVGFEAKFDLNEILGSVCDFSDDFSYSSEIVERHIKGGSGLNMKLIHGTGKVCPVFFDLCDPETFAVFQSEFVDATTKFYSQRSEKLKKNG